MSDGQTIFVAFAGGILPAVLWLWFWRREDRRRPEPRGLIALTFLAGMMAVPLVIPFQKIVASAVLGGERVELVARMDATTAILAMVLWAAIEEILKYGAARLAALRRKDVDEPIDPVIYLITAALGFSALENAMFILNPLLEQNPLVGIITGNLRFIGATLLHVTSSAAVGVFLAFSFYKPRRVQRLYAAAGVILAVALHTVFNFSIIKSEGSKVFLAFSLVWLAVVILLAVLEKVKRVHPTAGGY